MTVDRKPVPPGDTTAGLDTTSPAVPVTRATVVWYSLVGAVLVGWFLFGWLVLRQGFVDSLGESLGAGSALRLVVAVVGTVRRTRR
ncbi:MAG TPA: hypothetical protein VGD43_24585 [Micromonospora sp.]